MRKIVGIIISLFLFFSMGYTQESESETNDSYSTADTITINNSVSGNIGQVNNSVTDWHDWFLFITESDGKISFIGSPSSDLNIKLSLYDTNGGTVIEDALLNGTGVNDTLIFKVSINKAWNSSMEIGIYSFTYFNKNKYKRNRISPLYISKYVYKDTSIENPTYSKWFVNELFDGFLFG